MFWRDEYAIRYWAELFNCLNVTAQFRYLRYEEVVHSIAGEGTLTFISGNKYKRRMLIYNATKHPDYESDPIHRMKQKAAGSLFFYDISIDSCAQPDANGRYIMQKSRGCDDTEEQQKFTFGKKKKSTLTCRLCIFIYNLLTL